MRILDPSIIVLASWQSEWSDTLSVCRGRVQAA